MNLKLIAAALALGLSAQAHASIANGATGNGELFLNLWDGSTSYTRDLNTSIDSFDTLVNGAGLINTSFAADALMTSFLGGANLANLRWNVVAVDTSGAQRLLTTYAGASLPAVQGDSTTRLATTSVNNILGSINPSLTGSINSATFDSTNPGYAGKAAFGSNFNNKMPAGFDNTAALGSSMNFMRINAASINNASSVYTQYMDSSAVKFTLASNGVLTVAAVPEPESYAMMLAGLGLVGVIARRRMKNAA